MNKFVSKPDYQHISKKILDELQSLKNGDKSPFLGVKTYFPQKPIITSGTIQVVVLGGTNYDFAVVDIEEGQQPVISFREKGKLQPINSKEDFLKLLDTHLTTKVDAIALNVGFPLVSFQAEKGQPDGKFIKATKEHTLLGLLGHKVSEFVLEKYIPKHNSYAVVAAANDIVCLTETDAGVVIGTGFNMGIKGKDEQGTYVLNLEAGNSASIEANEELEEIDKNSKHYGHNRFEKMMSGYYLPQHFNLLAQKHNLNEKIKKAEEMAELAATNDDKAGELARELFARSAGYAASQIAALYEFQGKPEKLTISAEGSLFMYGYKYQKTLKQELLELGIPANVITFHTNEESSIHGALRLFNGKAI